MSKLTENIKQLSEEILEFLLDYKSKNSTFTFSLRQRESAQNGKAGRFEKGQWFQGSHYIYIPLFKRGDSARKIKTIGFVIDFDKEGNFEKSNVEISFKSGITDVKEIEFHQKMAKYAQVLLGPNNHGKKPYSDPKDLWTNLKNYITDFRTHALALIESLGIEDKYIITEKEFQKSLQKINEIRMLPPNIATLKVNNKNDKPFYKNPLNQILYGPPGTGKTYATIVKSVAIVEGISEEEVEIKYPEREKLKEYFNSLFYDHKKKEGQIAFTTFHQSMSYEDFVEGIKPGVDNRNVVYGVKPGIFQQMSDAATDNWLDAKKGKSAELSFDESFNNLKEDIEENPDTKFSMKTKNRDFKIIGFTDKSIQFEKANGSTSHTLSINTLRDYFYGDREVRQTGVGIYYPSILDKLKSYKGASIKDKNERRYVLIIDEINRGNVSAIFGELITLLEPDKRLGNDEALEVVLPYSQERFAVPSNLYIIGTMNTADRSVEALDTALRRRFSFVEVMPQPSLLSPSALICDLFWKYEESDWNEEPYKTEETKLFIFLGVSEDLINQRKDIWVQMKGSCNKADKEYFKDFIYAGFNLELILETINNRVEALLDRDHTIGHSYFIKVNDKVSLVHAFKNCIIPLLQEYFYGDYEKINLVLGDGFICKDTKNSVTFAGSNFISGYGSSERYIFPELTEENIDSAIRKLLNERESVQVDEATEQ